jgi:hypothetical protein
MNSQVPLEEEMASLNEQQSNAAVRKPLGSMGVPLSLAHND